MRLALVVLPLLLGGARGAVVRLRGQGDPSALLISAAGRKQVFVHNATATHQSWLQRQAPVTVEHESWFQRMGDAFSGILTGILLMWFSIPCMWVNERRAARMESLIEVGRADCVPVGADRADPDRRGSLVHVKGGEARGVAALQDSRFDQVVCQRGCLRLRSTVEVFQWKEEARTTETKDSVGGGTTKRTTYTYSKAWLSEINKSDDFHDKGHRNVVLFPGLEPGQRSQTCPRVEYGDAFALSSDLVDQLADWQAEAGSGPFSLKELKFKDRAFRLGPDLYYGYYQSAKSHQPGDRVSPEIGDVRVRIEYVPDGPATVLALQAEGETTEGRDVFLPYRMVSRGLCSALCGGLSKEALKELLLSEARKDAGELYEQDKCDCGPLSCCFCCCTCACNLVTFCFSSVAPPQVYRLFPGSVSVNDCWKRVSMTSNLMKWVIRLIAWVMLFSGTYSLFKPLEVALDIVPFLGPYLGSFAAWVIWVACFLVTLVVATLVISMAYLAYHPRTAFVYLAFAACTAGIVVAICAAVASSAH